MNQFSQGLKYIIIAGIIALITLLFPKTTQLNFNFVKGQKWLNDDVTANFDFTVNPDQDIIDLEKGRIERDHRAHFDKSNINLAQALNDLNNYLLNQNDSLVIDMTQLSATMSGAYNRGVVRDQDFEKYANKTINYKVEGNTVDKAFAEFVTIDNVKKELASSIGINNSLLDGYVFNENVVYNEGKTKQVLQEKLSNLNVQGVEISKGDVLISSGQTVSKDRLDILNAYKNAYAANTKDNKSPFIVFVGYLLLTCLIIGALLFFLISYYPSIYDNNRKLTFVLIWPLIFASLVALVESSYGLSAYLIPFCIVPIVIKNFYNARLALFVHIVVILIASFLSNLGYEFTFLQILVGIVAVLFSSETRYWDKFFIALGIILGTYLLGYLGLSLIKTGSFTGLDWYVFPWLMLNVFLCLLAYPFIPLIERVFGFTSDITLKELSDMNRPLLKEMSLKAPGTLQHSLQVSNLAEAATEKIGGNSLLIKVAALYHDIGKIPNSQYFIENQSGGQNPHDELSNIESAKIIIGHISEGMAMAKKARLPKVITDFIQSHHGTTRVEYFYRNHLKENPEHNFDESLFRYPGPNPITKEETILMMADSIEAASKSLKNPTGQDIDQLVDKIVNFKLEHHQLDDSMLTFDDLEKCKSTFKSLLRNIYHVRVEYPEEPKS